MLGKAIKELKLPREELVIMTKVRPRTYPIHRVLKNIVAIRCSCTKVRHEPYADGCEPRGGGPGQPAWLVPQGKTSVLCTSVTELTYAY